MDIALGLLEIVQLLGDKGFYEENPAFLFLKEQAQVEAKRYLEAVADPRRQNCCEDRVDDRKYISASSGSFIKMLKELQELENPEPLQTLKKYLSKKLEKPVRTVTLKYKVPNKETQILVF